jgi:hypothetical protein
MLMLESKTTNKTKTKTKPGAMDDHCRNQGMLSNMILTSCISQNVPLIKKYNQKVGTEI